MVVLSNPVPRQLPETLREPTADPRRVVLGQENIAGGRIADLTGEDCRFGIRRRPQSISKRQGAGHLIAHGDALETCPMYIESTFNDGQ